MAPNSPVVAEEPKLNENQTKKEPVKERIVWSKVIFFIYLHYGALLGIYYLLTEAKWQIYIWCTKFSTLYFILLLLLFSVYFLCLISTQGIGAGVHRLWTHRTYKAKLPLRILLAVYQTLTFQKDIYDWARDHRAHHKYSDTEADPHNASRGFFYSHMGWLMQRKSETVITNGKKLDLSDLEADPVVMFQRKYYWYLAPLIAFIIPATIPWYFWGESFRVAWYTCNMLRIFLSLHITCLVNSAAHIFGNRPYDKNILPTQNPLVSFLSNGEGFHNYHHAFPWDYKAAELGNYWGNWSTAFIDIMAKIGWAYDLKSAPLEMVERKVKKTGDGTWKLVGYLELGRQGYEYRRY